MTEVEPEKYKLTKWDIIQIILFLLICIPLTLMFIDFVINHYKPLPFPLDLTLIILIISS